MTGWLAAPVVVCVVGDVAGAVAAGAVDAGPVAGGVRRGVGKRIGVTATIIAVSRSAIESLLSIYGTGS